MAPLAGRLRICDRPARRAPRVAIVAPALIALLAQRYIVRGLTFGAVKG